MSKVISGSRLPVFLVRVCVSFGGEEENDGGGGGGLSTGARRAEELQRSPPDHAWICLVGALTCF